MQYSYTEYAFLYAKILSFYFEPKNDKLIVIKAICQLKIKMYQTSHANYQTWLYY